MTWKDQQYVDRIMQHLAKKTTLLKLAIHTDTTGWHRQVAGDQDSAVHMRCCEARPHASSELFGRIAIAIFGDPSRAE